MHFLGRKKAGLLYNTSTGMNTMPSVTRVAMKNVISLLYLLVLGATVSSGKSGDQLLLMLLNTQKKEVKPSVSRVYLSGIGTALVGTTLLGGAYIKKKLGQDLSKEQEGPVLPAPKALYTQLYQLLLECGFNTQEADEVELCIQVLPKDVYGYADYMHNRIVLNAQWCMLADCYSSRFDKLWATVVSWGINPAIKFIFCHEALHLRHHQQVPYKSDPEYMRKIILFCEMEADLGALDVLLKNAHWGAVCVSMGKVAFDALVSVAYDSWSPSATERYRYWKKFCTDYMRNKKPHYQEYANKYIEQRA